MHFGENQLSRNLIGLSPLTPGHPLSFQPKWVRSSTRSYPRFNLPRARSSRFGSRTRDWKRLLRLAFATPPPNGLGSPHATDSQTHFSIGTPSPHTGAPTVRRRTVSGTLSLPSRGAFHLSLTVLVHYRSDRYTQAYPTVWADSHGIPRGPRYSGHGYHQTMRVRLRGHHPLRPGIQPGSPHTRFSILAAGASAPARPLPRHRCRNPRRVSHGTGLAIIRFRSPLLTEYPFLQVLRCFTSLRTPRKHSCGAGPQQPAGYPIRTPSDQSPVGGSPRPIAAPHVLHRYCLPRHPPYAHGNKPTNPAKKGTVGPMPPALEHPTTTNQII